MTLPQKIWPGKFGTRSKLVVTRYRNESDENNISIKGAVWYKYKREDMPGGAAGYRNVWSSARNRCVWSRGAVSEWFRRTPYLDRQCGVVQGIIVFGAVARYRNGSDENNILIGSMEWCKEVVFGVVVRYRNRSDGNSVSMAELSLARSCRVRAVAGYRNRSVGLIKMGMVPSVSIPLRIPFCVLENYSGSYPQVSEWFRRYEQ
ncbi:hypothetical protein B0H16DRAFT_1460441 [Mycena metata]|uniref:Uncharacterized protein n=1 Tax=Mycena metata TaxID=1033252 RepID=A0AAD7IYE4_9AGAR|nr:hypothetical protein B0H16DRAFT_1460441 [Mycena metata]